MSYVQLRDPKHRHDKDERIKQDDYDQSLPFFVGERNVLAHRVKSLYLLSPSWANEPWFIVEYWCESSGRTYDIETAIFADPGDRILCARCEAAAVAHGEKAADKLCGRHVHIGGLRAIQFCCARNSN